MPVRVNTDTGINVVTADVTYDANKLEYVSNSAAGTAFALHFADSPSTGKFSVTRAVTSGTVSGNQLITTVKFRAKADGVANISASGRANAGAQQLTLGGNSLKITIGTTSSGSGSASQPTANNNSTQNSGGTNDSSSTTPASSDAEQQSSTSGQESSSSSEDPNSTDVISTEEVSESASPNLTLPALVVGGILLAGSGTGLWLWKRSRLANNEVYSELENVDTPVYQPSNSAPAPQVFMPQPNQQVDPQIPPIQITPTTPQISHSFNPTPEIPGEIKPNEIPDKIS